VRVDFLIKTDSGYHKDAGPLIMMAVVVGHFHLMC